MFHRLWIFSMTVGIMVICPWTTQHASAGTVGHMTYNKVEKAYLNAMASKSANYFVAADVTTAGPINFPPLPTTNSDPPREPVAGIDYVEDELLVKFKQNDNDDTTKKKIHDKHGSRKIKTFKFINVDHVKIRHNLTAEEAINQYMSDPEVEYAEPNII